ncbi:MAG: PqqD family protein [Thermodesulfobacteriota bacterium]
MENYKIRTPQISHETIDGETVIINLDNGNYYSLNGIGADIWNLIENGADKKSITGIIKVNYDIIKVDFENSLNNLINELLSEGLIVTSGDNKHVDLKDVKLISKEINNNAVYKEPSLEKYTDMQDLLLLDPIHEVDDNTGWPTPKDSEGDY